MSYLIFLSLFMFLGIAGYRIGFFLADLVCVSAYIFPTLYVFVI